MTATGYVYFIHASETGLIKIGFSKNPAARFRRLQAMSADDLEMIGIMPGDVMLEWDLHQRFKQQRRHSEWFESSPDLLEVVRQCPEHASSLTLIQGASPLLNVQQAAEYLDMSPNFVRDHAAELGGSRMENKLKFPLANLVAYVERCRVTAAEPVQEPTPLPVRKAAPQHYGTGRKNPVTGRAYGIVNQ